MKPVVVVVVVAVLAALAVALTRASAGTSGPAADPKIAALQKQVNQTNKLVAKLDARVKVLEASNKTLKLVAVGTLAAIACEAAMAADTFQTTWGVVDQIAQTAQNKVYFGPQTPLNDQSSCSDLSLARQVSGSPPSLVPLSKLIDFVYGP